nr:nonstructural protein 1a [Mamastrovirus sp.]
MASQGRLYASRVDEAINSGSYLARQQARWGIDQLPDIEGFHPEAPWHFSAPLEHVLDPSKPFSNKRVPCASSVDANNTWRTFSWDGHTWQEVPPAPENQTTVLVAALLNDRLRRVEEIKNLKLQNSSLRNEIEWLRHQVTRLTPTPPRRSIMPYVLLFVFLLFLFITSARAEITTSSTRSYSVEQILKTSEDLEAFIEHAKRIHFTKMVTDRSSDFLETRTMGLIDIYVDKLYRFWGYTGRSFQNDIVYTISTICSHYIWEIVSICLAVYTVFTDNNPFLSLTYLAVATCTGFKFALLSISPIHTTSSAVMAIIIGISYIIDPFCGLTVAMIQMIAIILCGMCMSDAAYITHLRSHFITFIVYCCVHALKVVGLNPNVVGVAVVIIRLISLLPASGANTIEIRNAEGKVVSKLTAWPGAIFRFVQRMKQKTMVRSQIAPMVRIQPAALCTIKTPESSGSGFFVTNYIATAGHVVGVHTVVTVHYNGSEYQANVKRHVNNKDICLIVLPTALQQVPRLKVAAKPDYSWVCVCAPDNDGAFVTTTTPGLAHDGAISYATPTKNGMSGAPVLDSNGHVLGVHQTNTGYTGGAVILTPSDVLDPPKVNNGKALLEEIESLKKQLAMKQCEMEDQDIVDLVRCAVQREFSILRAELNQSKGKTKKGRGRPLMMRHKKRRVRVWTEEDYKRLLEAGFTKEELRRIARDIINSYTRDDDDDEEKAPAGFPEWSDPDLSDDSSVWSIATEGYEDENYNDNNDEDWDRDKRHKEWDDSYDYEQCAPSKFGKRPRQANYSGRFDPGLVKQAMRETTKADRVILGEQINKVVKSIEKPDELGDALYHLDASAYESGLPLFLERVRPRPKPPRHPPPKVRQKSPPPSN